MVSASLTERHSPPHVTMKGIKMTIAIDQLTQQYPLIKELISLKEHLGSTLLSPALRKGCLMLGLIRATLKTPVTD